MAKMKSLTVNGQTYFVEDADSVSFGEAQELAPEQQEKARKNIGAASIDDTKVGADAWSSKNTIDKLCPSFIESGSVVTCEPVEGYPLEAVTYGVSNPNLIPVDLTDEGNWELEDPEGLGWYSYRMDLPSGTYTIYAESPLQLQVTYQAGGGEAMFDLMGGEPIAFDHYGGEFWFMAMDGSYGFVKLEAGTEYTGTNYTAATRITRCGKNLASTDILVGATGITENDGIFSGTIDKFYRTTQNIGFVPAGAFEEGQQYVFSLYAKKGTAASSPYMVIRYTDGTQGCTKTADANIKAVDDFVRYTPVSIAGKTVQGVWISYGAGGTDTLYIKDIQVEKARSATTYEPFMAETFAPGESIPAIPGVNTIFADVGLVTVTGKANPSAIIEKLTNQVNALSATMVALTGV